MLHIKAAKHISDFKLWLSFDDGSSGEVDLNGTLIGPIFEPLKNIDVFSQVAIDPELETIVWPNGADLAPEYLKELHNKQFKSDS
ncbi:MAG: hypothetical protein COB35_12275 [Gammaproteobacteria bacterium]|nr:MAG: hypothetical protein COB35_12275 [Gammaproteobacteria bacterium]